MKPIYEKLGLAAPEKAEDYGFTAMEGVDPEFAQTAQGWMHELGVPPKMATALAEKWNAFANAQREGLLREASEETAAELGRLQGEWGARYDERVEIARRAVRQFGFSEEQLAAMETSLGAGDLYRKFYDIGMRLNEGAFIEGFAVSPEAARAQHAELMSDKAFMAKYLAGDLAARKRMSDLNLIISGAQARQGGL